MKPWIFRLLLAFVLVLVLTIMPLPALVSSFRPPWVFLLIFYLCCYFPQPQKMPVGSLFLTGLILDALSASVLGEHAFALCLSGWIMGQKTARFPFYSTLQQMAVVGFSCMGYQSIVLLMDAFMGYSGSILQVVGIALVSALLWPWLRLAAEAWLVMPVVAAH